MRSLLGAPYAVVAQTQEQAASNGQVAGWSPADGARMEDRLTVGRGPLEPAALVRTQLLQPSWCRKPKSEAPACEAGCSGGSTRPTPHTFPEPDSEAPGCNPGEAGAVPAGDSTIRA